MYIALESLNAPVLTNRSPTDELLNTSVSIAAVAIRLVIIGSRSVSPMRLL